MFKFMRKRITEVQVKRYYVEWTSYSYEKGYYRNCISKQFSTHKEAENFLYSIIEIMEFDNVRVSEKWVTVRQ